MFNSMKNQFREKTGKEVPKFTPQKGGLSRQSRQGSESSVCSLVLDTQQPSPSPMVQDLHQLKLPDGKVLTNKDVNLLAKKEEEWRQRFEKKETEWAKKLEKREAEIHNEWASKEEAWKKTEQNLTEDLLKQTNELKDALKTAEDFKRKVAQYQEERDTLEGFQTQEISKIKHLLLAKEKECSELSSNLKETASLVESLKSEVGRLRPFEEQVSNFQDELELLRHTSEKERWHLSSKLAQSEEQVRHLTDRVAVLTRRSESDAGLAAALPADDRVQALLGERALLERRLEEAHVHLTDIKASWSAQIASLETQVGRLSRQAGEEGAERRSAEAKVSELEAKLEEEVKEREVLSGRVTKLSEECATLSNDLKAANNLVASKDEDISELSKKIHDLEAVCEVLRSKKRDLQMRCDDEMEKARKLEEEIENLSNGIGALSEDKLRLENELRIEKEKWKATDDELARERSAKDESLLRNAQISQEVNMAQQNLRQQQTELDELLKKVSLLEQDMVLKEEALSQSETRTAAATKELQDKLNRVQDELESKKANEEVERGLRAKIADLEEQTTEKNKTIRVLQQKLSDVKKTLQREFKTSDNGTAEIIPNHTANHVNNVSIVKPSSNPDSEVSHLYMKNVIMKFLTSREYEALHLTKAVATLLKLSHEEETLLKDTVTWRMSWFRTKPRPEDYIHS
ncbi:GRIP domain [Nesidiocoris tenuis]|uniref:GRIP domain n=1 Tax=Nesidiocoris tenuis TaxID=355587 RepID=A0ABN7ABL1_9HEMI|nr:GRIP domain [Nesidiocoris tenuis]